MVKSNRSRGGKERARKLSPEERSKIAKQAAEARWEDLPEAICGSPDHPLKIADVEIACYVLEGGTRVLSQASFLEALGRHPKASVKPQDLEEGEQPAPPLLQAKGLRPFLTDSVLQTAALIPFRLPSGVRALGYRAELLPEICELYLKARDADALQTQQLNIARQAEILIRGLAHVGIIALVDEVTGYQEVRAKDALAQILEEFIAKELQPWLTTFPTAFYKELFRLRDLEFPKDSVKRPQYFGLLTNDIVYRRMAPGVLDELKRVTVRNDEGRPRHKYFQRLTSNVGYPKLREHLGAVVAIMQLSNSWKDFMRKVDQLYPRYGTTMQLPLDYDDDTGL